MKKLIIPIIASFLVVSTAYAFKPATLYTETWEGIKRVAVYTQEQADNLFKQGYLLDENLLGTSITTINGSDTLKDSRTIINDNFTALNNGKIEISTTSLPLITTLSGLTTAGSLATVGTITSGIWNGTAISVSKGGTGTTTPTLNQIMIGNGANGLKVIGFGNSGQFLTSQGDGSAPQWTTSSVDESGDYDWAGEHTFATTTIATSTITKLTASDLTIASGTISGYPVASSSVASKGYIDAGTYFDVTTTGATSTDTTLISADTERSTQNDSYEKNKEIKLRIYGSINVAFCLKTSDIAKAVNGRIYKNSVAVGTERSTNSSSYVCYQETFNNIYPGDLIQIYAKDGGGGATVYIKYFKVSYTKALSTEYTINTD